MAAYQRNEGMDPSLLRSMVERLPDNSMTVALGSGGRHMFGWGAERFMMADLYDAINLNTMATGNFKKRPDIKPYPRPKSTLTQKRKTGSAERPRQVNLKQLHANLMMRAARQGR